MSRGEADDNDARTESVRIDEASAVRQIDLRAVRAWPATIVEERDGWLLRHSPGVTRRRSNSALPPIRRSPGIDHVERFYREYGMPVRIQVSPAEHHAELDAVLAARGYGIDGRTAILTAATKDVIAATASATPVDVAHAPSPWLAAFAELDDHADSAVVGARVISRVAAPVAFLSVPDGDRAAGIGLFAAESGWAGIFCMATRPEYRGRGVATAVLRAGARWAAGQGADRLYLQVERNNETARRLYTRVGFVHSHDYHYRVHP